MRQSTFTAGYSRLEERIKAAWKDMHHNASIARHHPAMRNEYEQYLFDQWLSDEASAIADGLEALLRERFGVDTRIYSAGRCGATFYPDVYHAPIGGNGFGRFRWEVFHRGYGSDKEELADMKRVAGLLEFFNAFWRRQAASVGRRWRAYKRCNGLSADIRAHDGKRRVQTYAWI